MAEMDREVRFCYRCGKRVGKNLLNCWYCSSPTARVIRPPRNCPYCQTRINPKALKCPHCGEFVDGRPQQAHQHLTLNIDKAVIGPGGIQPMGGPQPQAYNPQQFYAPPTGDPSRTLNSQGYQQLPPGGSELLLPGQGPQDASPLRRGNMLPGPGGEPYPGAGDPSSSALAPYGGQPPVPYGGQPLAPQGGGDFLSLSGPPSQQMMVPGNAGGGGSMVPYTGSMMTTTPAEEERYAVCKVCNTEILNSDSFCFYCGQVHTAGSEKAKPAGAVSGVYSESNGLFYWASLILFAISTLLRTVPQLSAFNDPLNTLSAAGLGVLLLVWAFFRSKKIMSRVLTVLVLLIGLFIVAMGGGF